MFLPRWTILLLGWFVVHVVSATPTQDMASIDNEWRALITPLLPLGARLAEEFPQAADPLLRQELFRFIYSQLGAGYMHLTYANAEHPDLIPNWSQVFNNAAGLNPDSVYQFTPLAADGVYRVAGFRGTVRLIDFQLGDSPSFVSGKANERGTFGPTFANYDADELHLSADGAFEFVLSATRPKDHQGDWRALPPKSNYLLVRQIAYDWVHEVDGRIAIERLDRPAAKPRDSAADIRAALQQIPNWAEHWVKMSIGVGAGAKSEPGKIEMLDMTKDQGGRATQVYMRGRFELSADEALLIKLRPGQCRFWNLHLANELSQTLDFMNHQIGLNGYTAKPDADGAYRLVIAASDPGVPNWLDTTGYTRGFFWGRLDRCDQRPEPVAKKLKLKDLRAQLPAETPHMSAAEREAALRLHRQGAQLRHRW